LRAPDTHSIIVTNKEVITDTAAACGGIHWSSREQNLGLKLLDRKSRTLINGPLALTMVSMFGNCASHDAEKTS
jgi:hypothetical protein